MRPEPAQKTEGRVRSDEKGLELICTDPHPEHFMVDPSAPTRAAPWLSAPLRTLSRILQLLAILLLSICVGELALAGARLLRAERPGRSAQNVIPENLWSEWREMQEQARAMGFR